MSDTALLQKEFNIRRSAIAYTMCTDEDIWEEIKKEREVEEEALVTPSIPDACVSSSANHLVDCDADPFIPPGCRVEEHRKGGIVKLERHGDDLYANGKKIELFLADGQEGGYYIEGHKLRKELANKPVLNANILDYLIKSENQHLIPESWKGKCVFFWGDVYRDSHGIPYVRCLFGYWHAGRWLWDHRWLDRDFDSRSPAAISAN